MSWAITHHLMYWVEVVIIIIITDTPPMGVLMVKPLEGHAQPLLLMSREEKKTYENLALSTTRF